MYISIKGAWFSYNTLGTYLYYIITSESEKRKLEQLFVSLCVND